MTTTPDSRAASLSTPKAEPGPVLGYYIYMPDNQTGYLVEDLDDAIDDLTNEQCEITPLVAAALSDRAAETAEYERMSNELGDVQERLRLVTDQRDRLADTAQAVVARWDSPVWKDAPHTADFINELRAALSAAPTPAAPKVLTDERINTLRNALEESCEWVAEYVSQMSAYTISDEAKKCLVRSRTLLAEAELTQPLPGNPAGAAGEGWQWVPIEPTKQMLVLGENGLHRASQGDFAATEGEIEACWKAMLAAAPDRKRLGLSA